MRHPARTLDALFMVIAIGAVASRPGMAQEASTPLPAAACMALMGMVIPASAIGLPSQGAAVQSATMVADAAEGNGNANRSRPLCEWPTWPKFAGASGNEGNAASFACVN